MQVVRDNLKSPKAGHKKRQFYREVINKNAELTAIRAKIEMRTLYKIMQVYVAICCILAYVAALIAADLNKYELAGFFFAAALICTVTICDFSIFEKGGKNEH